MPPLQSIDRGLEGTESVCEGEVWRPIGGQSPGSGRGGTPRKRLRNTSIQRRSLPDGGAAKEAG